MTLFFLFTLLLLLSTCTLLIMSCTWTCIYKSFYIFITTLNITKINIRTWWVLKTYCLLHLWLTLHLIMLYTFVVLLTLLTIASWKVTIVSWLAFLFILFTFTTIHTLICSIRIICISRNRVRTCYRGIYLLQALR